jgi:hypothetical protein
MKLFAEAKNEGDFGSLAIAIANMNRAVKSELE